MIAARVLLLLLAFASVRLVAAEDAPAAPDLKDILGWARMRVEDPGQPDGPAAHGVVKLIREKGLAGRISAVLPETTDLAGFPYPAGKFQVARLVPSPVMIHGRKMLVLLDPDTEQVWIIDLSSDRPLFYRGTLGSLKSAK